MSDEIIDDVLCYQKETSGCPSEQELHGITQINTLTSHSLTQFCTDSATPNRSSEQTNNLFDTIDKHEFLSKRKVEKYAVGILYVSKKDKAIIVS